MADLGSGEMKKNSNFAWFGDYGRGISASREDAPLSLIKFASIYSALLMTRTGLVVAIITTADLLRIL